MKYLFANGDSHTAGNEMEYEGQINCYEKAWPKQLADKLKLGNVNISKPGASNYHIFRTTQDWVIENLVLNENYKSEDLIVFVMWSGFDREEIYFPDTNVIDDVGFSSKMDYFNTGLRKELTIFQNSFATFHDNLVSNFHSLSLMYNLSLFLDSLKIKHYFINGLYSFIELSDLDTNHALYGPYKNLILSYQDKIKNHIGFYNKDDLYFDYMINYSGIEIPKHSKNSHYGEDGHKLWADRVYDIYFKKKLI
jgi:hypothetical protein